MDPFGSAPPSLPLPPPRLSGGEQTSSAMRNVAILAIALFAAICVVALVLGLYYGLQPAQCGLLCPLGQSCTSALQGACASCMSGADCSGSDGCVAGLCRAACIEDSECSVGTQCADGYCVGCVVSAECEAANVSTPICGPTQQCQACRVDANCPDGKFCETQTGQCISQCQFTPCPAGQGCVGNSCVQCTTNSDTIKCPGGGALSHCAPLGLCAQCSADTDCPTGQVCDAGACVERFCSLPSQGAGDTEAFIILNAAGQCLSITAPDASRIEMSWTTSCSGSPDSLFAYRDSPWRITTTGENVPSVVHIESQRYVQVATVKGGPVTLVTSSGFQPSVALVPAAAGFAIASNGMYMDVETLLWTDVKPTAPLTARYASVSKSACALTPPSSIVGAQLLTATGAPLAHYLALHKATSQAWFRDVSYLPNDALEFEAFALADDGNLRSTVTGRFLQVDLTSVGASSSDTARFRVRNGFLQFAASTGFAWSNVSYEPSEVGLSETPVTLYSAVGVSVPFITMNG